jgi:hypothetical protein
MKKINVGAVVLFVFVAGCNSFRFAPTEEQKQNAYLHNRTAAIAADTAKAENCSQGLQALTKLSEVQSRAFVAYNGLPAQHPKAETADDVLSETSVAITETATLQSADRPDVWKLTDSAFELAIAVCGLAGGIYGSKAASFLKQAQAKSQALKEIVQGNELFKKLNADSAEAFKDAQKGQSVETRQLVTEMKNA